MGITVCISSIRATTIGETITAIQQQDFVEWELFVVAQGTDPELRKAVEKAAESDPRIHCIPMTEFGLSRGRNAGIAAANYEIIAITDDDCAPAPNWLSVIDDYFSREPELGLLAGSLVAPPAERSGISICPATTAPEAIFDPETMQKCPESFCIVGANMALRKSAWLQVGAFEAEVGAGTSLPSSEDIEYAIRMEKCRIKMRCTPQSRVVHTYGRRYGWKAVIGLGQSYAQGQGAIAAKMTLGGSPDGAKWRRSMRKQCLIEPLRSLRLQRVPNGIVRWFAFRSGYDRCLQRFQIDEQGMLQKK